MNSTFTPDETCFMWMRHRYYDARHRGFLSRDPAEDDVLGNLYAFAENNSGTYVDPMGLEKASPGNWSPGGSSGSNASTLAYGGGATFGAMPYTGGATFGVIPNIGGVLPNVNSGCKPGDKQVEILSWGELNFQLQFHHAHEGGNKVRPLEIELGDVEDGLRLEWLDFQKKLTNNLLKKMVEKILKGIAKDVLIKRYKNLIGTMDTTNRLFVQKATFEVEFENMKVRVRECVPDGNGGYVWGPWKTKTIDLQARLGSTRVQQEASGPYRGPLGLESLPGHVEGMMHWVQRMLRGSLDRDNLKRQLGKALQKELGAELTDIPSTPGN